MIDITAIRSVLEKQVKDSLVLLPQNIYLQGSELKFTKPVKVDIVAVNKGNYINISGIIKAVVELKCGRCLELVELPLDVIFEENFYLESQLGQINEQKIMEEGYVYRGNEICINEIVEQNIIANLPLKVICSEDCKGFCPICGKKLNSKECGCVTEEVDPRLAVLEKLLKPSSSSKEVE